MRYLAIDIGASSGRHIAGEIEGGKIKLKEVYRFSNGACESGGSLVWGAERLFKEVLNGLKAAGQAGLAPDFVGIDTWAVDYALLNGGGNCRRYLLLPLPAHGSRDGQGARAFPV